jgi:hypothetical protein
MIIFAVLELSFGIYVLSMVLVNEKAKFVLLMFLFLCCGVTGVYPPHLEGSVLGECRSLEMGAIISCC